MICVNNTVQGRPATYPWDKWLQPNTPSGRSRTVIIKPDEYHASHRSMTVMIRSQARLRNVKVSLQNDKDGTIKITFPKE